MFVDCMPRAYLEFLRLGFIAYPSEYFQWFSCMGSQEVITILTNMQTGKNPHYVNIRWLSEKIDNQS